MHYALREVLGKHVEQKGSLVTPEKLRFDFSHFRQMTTEEIAATEQKVNEMIMKNIVSAVHDDTPMEEALAMGALALFGEKYGEKVRVVTFGDSVELCGGTHVSNTSVIGLFKIISEGAVAAGVRRIEAVTGRQALSYVNEKLKTLDEITLMLRSTGNPASNISKLMAENTSLRRTIEKMQNTAATAARTELENKAVTAGDCRIYSGVLEEMPAETLKNIAHQIRQSDSNSAVIIGSSSEGKASLLVSLGEEVIRVSGLSAVEIIKSVSLFISGGGGGQPFLATAGGKRPEGLSEAVEKAVLLVKRAF
jgi:alanyl-tRNA synthetase